MNGVLTYGSLLNPDERETVFSDANCIPVRIGGFRRHFAQKSTFREGDRGQRGVLTVDPDEEAWCNGLLVYPFTDAEFEEYKQRESGYEITSVDPDRIVGYDGYEVPEELTSVAIPCGARPLEDPTPIPSYAALCVEGARDIGDEFLADFLVTTHRE